MRKIKKISKWFMVLMLIAGALAMYGDATWYIDNTNGNPNNWLVFLIYSRWKEYIIMFLVATGPYTTTKILDNKRKK